MEKKSKIFDEEIDRLVKKGKVKIAFGLKEPNEEILNSLEKSKKYADIILVGTEKINKIENFELVISDNPERKIAEMLANKDVDGIIRGTIDDLKTGEAIEEISGEKSLVKPTLLEDTSGRRFFMGPISNPAAWDKEGRFIIAKEICKFMNSWGTSPRVAVFTGERHDTYPRKKHIKDGVTGILNKTYEDAEWIVAELKKENFEAKNVAIDLDLAVKDGYNIMIPVNGMVGNQIFRTLLFCGGKLLSCPALGVSYYLENNTRNEVDYEFHVKWLTAWINSSKE